MIYTVFFGKVVNGAKSWLGIGSFGIQPSEFGKIVFIFFMAWFLEQSESMPDRKRFVISLLILLLPLGLILLQPDLGTSSVYIPIFLVMCYMAGMPLRYLMMVFLTGMLTIIFTVFPIWESQILQKDLIWMNILTDQRLRLILILAFGSISFIGIAGYLLYKSKYFYWIAYGWGIATVALIMSIAAENV